MPKGPNMSARGPLIALGLPQRLGFPGRSRWCHTPQQRPMADDPSNLGGNLCLKMRPSWGFMFLKGAPTKKHDCKTRKIHFATWIFFYHFPWFRQGAGGYHQRRMADLRKTWVGLHREMQGWFATWGCKGLRLCKNLHCSTIQGTAV